MKVRVKGRVKVYKKNGKKKRGKNRKEKKE